METKFNHAVILKDFVPRPRLNQCLSQTNYLNSHTFYHFATYGRNYYLGHIMLFFVFVFFAESL